MQDLLSIMRRLRAPDGCPWDREQTVRTIVPHTVEEAYEVAEAALAEVGRPESLLAPELPVARLSKWLLGL